MTKVLPFGEKRRMACKSQSYIEKYLSAGEAGSQEKSFQLSHGIGGCDIEEILLTTHLSQLWKATTIPFLFYSQFSFEYSQVSILLTIKTSPFSYFLSTLISSSHLQSSRFTDNFGFPFQKHISGIDMLSKTLKFGNVRNNLKLFVRY